jgi:hypothetical protein
MKVIIDGKTLRKKIGNDVKVIWENMDYLDAEGKETHGQLHLTATHEGLIVDFFDDKTNECTFTRSFDFEDVADTCQ